MILRRNGFPGNRVSTCRPSSSSGKLADGWGPIDSANILVASIPPVSTPPVSTPPVQYLRELKDRRSVDRLFALASMASVVGQHERATSYARQAVAPQDESPSLYQLRPDDFDRMTVTYKSLVDAGRADRRALDRWSLPMGRPEGGCGCGCGGDDRRCCRRSSVTEYAERLDRETVDLCRDFCAVVDRHVLPGLDRPAHRAHAFKLKGDFYRYMYEASPKGPLKEWSAAKSCRSYQRGYDTIRRARSDPGLDTVRLDLAVNFAACLELVFGTEHAAAFVRRVLDDTVPRDECRSRETSRGGHRGRPGPTTAARGDLQRAYYSAIAYLDRCGRRCAAPYNDDLDPGFCTSDASDAEPEQ